MKTLFRTLLWSVFALSAAACSSSPYTTRGSDSPQNFDNSVDIALYKKAVREQPTNPHYLIGLARRYLGTMQWNLAAAGFREALLIVPGERQAMVGYSHALVAMGQYQESLQLASAVMNATPDTKAMLIAGVSLDGLKDTEASNGLYQHIIQMNPRNLSARNNLALSLAFQGREEAYDIMRQVALSPDAQMRHKRNLVLVNVLLGHPENAKRDGNALNISPEITKQIVEIGRRARQQGVDTVGIASVTDL